MNSLNLYHIFYTVAECGNISAAAKKLYISQPAVSKSISKLEEEFPTPLLIRTSKGVTLTENGEILFRQLEHAFSAIRQGEEQILNNNENGVGRISIGVSTTLCKYVLMERLKDFMEKYPNIKVSISCQSTYETINDLENGSLDIGLVGESDRLGSLAFTPLQTISDIFVCNKDYIRNISCIEQNIFSTATFLMLNKNNATRQYVDKHLLIQGVSLENQMEVTTMDLLIEFAKVGLGIACVIKEFVEKELNSQELISFPLKHEIPGRQIGFAYSKNATQNPSVEKFLTLMH